MYSYGNASTHVGGLEGVPVPKVAAAPTGFVGWTVCHCGLKHRPGAYHLCIDLGTPEAIVAPKPKKKAAKAKTKRKPAAARKTTWCACGTTISTGATSCRPCEDKRRKEAGIIPPRYVGRIDSRIEEVVRRYEAGESTQRIADDVGASSSGVRQAIVRRGVTLRTRGEARRGAAPGRALTDEQAAEAARLYLSGLSMDAVGVHFGISQHAVSNTMRRLGVKRRPRGGNQGRAA